MPMMFSFVVAFLKCLCTSFFFVASMLIFIQANNFASENLPVGTVLSDPVKRREYDKKGVLYTQDCNVTVSSFYAFKF